MKEIRCCYTWQLWEKLHHHSHAKIKAQGRQLHLELHNTKKGDKSIVAFFARIKSIRDSLLSIGETVSVQEQLNVNLKGLPSEFESTVTLLSTKFERFEFDKSSLLSLHMRIKSLSRMRCSTFHFMYLLYFSDSITD